MVRTFFFFLTFGELSDTLLVKADVPDWRMDEYPPTQVDEASMILDNMPGGNYYGASSSTGEKNTHMAEKRSHEERYMRMIRGVVEECCHQPCGYGQLKLYCLAE